MEIRTLGAGDDRELRETAEIYIESFHKDYTSFYPEEELKKFNVDDETTECKQWLQQGRDYVLYAGYVGDTMVGYVSVCPYTDEPLPYEIELSNLYVRCGCRNKGYGLALLHHAVRELVAQGKASLIVYCYERCDAHGWYRSVGGEEIRRVTQHAGQTPLEVVYLVWDTRELLATLDEKLKRY